MHGGVATVALAVLLGLAPSFSAQAGEATEHAKSKHARQRITEMTVAGKVIRNTWKDMNGMMRVSYSVVTAGGDRVNLATGYRAEDGQPTLSQLDKFTDKEVTMVGRGYTVEEGDKTVAYLISVTRILVIDPDAGK